MEQGKERVMSTATKIHHDVADFYTKAATSPAGSCCGCGGEATPKGVTARVAGYGEAELGALPADAVENSFGCGDPVAFAQVREGETVLDLGSGAGIDLLLAAAKVGPKGRVIGVDMTEAMIAKARRNIAEAGLDNVEVREGLIEELPVDSASVDWVISNCVINLSPDKPKVFAEIARVLKPGGRMVVSDIVVEQLPQWVRQNETLHAACVAGAISEQAYRDGLAAAGLEEIEVEARLVYDAAQVEALLRSEVPGAEAAPEGAGKTYAEIAQEIAGNIWSAKFSARRGDG
jgi:SAM-dependent methyltransferase